MSVAKEFLFDIGDRVEIAEPLAEKFPCKTGVVGSIHDMGSLELLCVTLDNQEVEAFVPAELRPLKQAA